MKFKSEYERGDIWGSLIVAGSLSSFQNPISTAIPDF